MIENYTRSRGNLNAKEKAKLERYLKNSSRFLWGLGPGNQKDTYEWLRSKGFVFDNGSYANVASQLLEDTGIEKIVNDLIQPRVKELISDKALDFLRICWQAGSLPNISFLKLYNIKNAQPFLEVNTQFNYVERWGELAGLWFEEIENMQDDNGSVGRLTAFDNEDNTCREQCSQ